MEETPPIEVLPDYKVKIGPAGWAYQDWEGVVYPAQLKREQHPVEYLAQYFDTIEITSSFQGHLRPEIAKLWCRKARAVNREFVFTAKLYRGFTHAPNSTNESTSARSITPGEHDERLAKEGLDGLAGHGMLGALLAQFPVSFRNNNENRDYLETLVARFQQYPLVVEARHASWNNEGILRYFAQKGVGFCNIDYPPPAKSAATNGQVPAPVAHLRLLERTYKHWFIDRDNQRASDRRDARYDYLYSEDELRDWKQNIARIAPRSPVTFVVTSNHIAGKSVANALQLKHLVSERPVAVPEIMLRQYPELERIAQTSVGRLS